MFQILWLALSFVANIPRSQNLALLSPRSLFASSRSPFTSYPAPVLVFQSPRQSSTVPYNKPNPQLDVAQSMQQPIKVDCPPGLAFIPYVIPCEPKPPEVTTPETTTAAQSYEYFHYPYIVKYKVPSPPTTTEPPPTPKPCKIFHHIYLYHIPKQKPPDPPTTTTTTEKPCESNKIYKYIYYPQIPSPEPVTTPMMEEASSPEPITNYIHGSNYHSSSFDEQSMLDDLLAKMSAGERR